MSAGLEGFLTGFFGARAEGMQRDKDKADAAEERLRNIAQRNSIIAQNRTSMAATAKSMGDQLLSWGATPEQIQAALGSGQTGLADLYKTVSTVHSTLDADEAKRFLGTVGADLGAAGAVGKEGLDNLYKSTFGLPMGMKTGDYKAPEESTLAKLFGYTDRKAKMMQNLDEEMSGVGGYSVYDLTTIGELPDYMPGSAGESVMYKAPSIYTQAKYSDSIQDVDSSLRLMESSDAYKNASKNITELSDRILKLNMSESPDPEIITRLEGQKLEEEQKINSLRDNVIKEAVLTQSNSYFNSDTYLEDMSRYVTNSLGYTPSWMPDLIESEKEVNAIVNQSLGGNLVGGNDDQTAAALAGVDPAAAKPTVIKTIKTEAGKDVNVVEVDGKTLVQTAGGNLMSEEDSAEMIEAAKQYSSKLDTKDGTVKAYQRYEDMYKGLMELPEDQRSDYLDAFDSLENIPSIKDAVEVIIEDAPAAADALGGYAYGGTGYGVSLFTEGVAAAYAFITGDTVKAAKIKGNAARNREEMKEVMANGIVDHLQKIVDDNNIKGGFGPDRAKAVKRAVLENKPLMNAVDSMVTENANGALEANPENRMVKVIAGMLGGDVNAIPAEEVSKTDAAAALYGKAQDTETGGGTFSASSKDVLGGYKKVEEEAEPDYAAAAMRAPEHLEKLGEQAKSVAKDLSSAISKAVSKAQTTAQEARAAKAALQEQGVTTEGMSERETIEAYDRQFLSDWKNMPVALKTIVLGSMVGKDKGMTEEETIRDLDRQFIMDWEGMPVQNKTIIRDVLYGKRVESFTDEQNKRLNEMRQTNPDWFIDTPPLGLPLPDASEVDTTFKSRTDRPTGMMSPLPAQRAGLEATPALGDTELDSMLTRIHGEGSADMQKFMSKVHTGKAKAADVTRIINSTKKLPKTATRAKVLEKLYELRDSIK